MPTFLWILLLLILLTAGVSGGIFYWQFRTWPPTVWKRRVERRITELYNRRDALKASAAGDVEQVIGRLATDYFQQHIGAISIESLIGRPGVGPGTVERVVRAGYRTLADGAEGGFANIHGIGPTRAADLNAAVVAATHDAQARFNAGACPEAVEFRREADAIRADVREQAAASHRELRAVDATLKQMKPLAELASDVTFWAFLFHREVPGLSDELLERPLPTLRVPPATAPAPRPVEPVPPPPAPVRPAYAAQPAAVSVPPPATPDVFLDWRPEAPASTTTEPAGMAEFRMIVGYAFVIAKADGKIAQAEKKVIREYLGTRFGHDPVLLRHIDPWMERTEKAVPAEATILATVKSATKADDRQALYTFAERIVDSSGQRNPREADLLARIATAFELNLAPKPSAAPPPPVAPVKVDPRSLLEITPELVLSPDLIRRRYTLLTDKLHPDRAMAMGPEFARLAAEKRTQLRAAAEALIAPFNVPLDPPAAPPPPADLRHNPDLDDVFGG